MVLDAARMLAASVHFCIALSIRLRRFAECEATLCAGSAASSNMSEAAAECLLTVASDLKEIAERDERVLKDFQSSQEKVSTAAWWLLANLVVCTLLLTKSVGPFGFESGTLIFAFLNGCCILAKTYGLTFRNVSLASVGAYLTGQLQLALGACVFIVPMLLLNLLFWIVVHLFLSATADWWPGFLLQPVSWAAMERLSVLMVSWWLLWKTAMLVEILANHSYYRLVLARRRSSGIPTIAYHLCDSVYAYSYSILGFQLGWRVLQFCAYFVYLATPYSWSASGIMLMLGLRASVASFGQGAKAVMHWSMHRTVHVQPFYTCWHKEHHFAASQTCLTACQDCGLLETGAEAAYVNLCFVLVPFFDNCAYVWNSMYNTLVHHYYEEYRNWHWKLAGQIILVQKHVHRIVSCFEWGSALAKLPPLRRMWPGFALNLQYPSADFASAHFADGSIEKHWHGRHHWSTEKHFGYGTYDSISNLVSDSTPEKCEEQLVQFLKEYLQLLKGQISTTSILSLVTQQTPKG
eukprot:s1437_g13.t1